MSDRCRICGAVDGRHDGAAHDNYVADMPPTQSMPLYETITIPRPHVPFGPSNLTAEESDAMYLREAAAKIERARTFGSNLTATLVKMLRDAADELAPEPHDSGEDAT